MERKKRVVRKVKISEIEERVRECVRERKKEWERLQVCKRENDMREISSGVDRIFNIGIGSSSGINLLFKP